jgi:hypothetical protein
MQEAVDSKITVQAQPGERNVRPHLRSKKGLGMWFKWYSTCLASVRSEFKLKPQYCQKKKKTPKKEEKGKERKRKLISINYSKATYLHAFIYSKLQWYFSKNLYTYTENNLKKKKKT